MSGRALQFLAAIPLVALAMCAATGCQLVARDANLASLDSAKAATPPQKLATVEIHPAGRRASLEPLPLQEGMSVSHALDHFKLPGRFSNMDVELYRRLPGAANRYHKMKVEYVAKKKAVFPLYDYALRPGDRLVVKEKTTSVLTTALNSILSPVLVSRMNER